MSDSSDISPCAWSWEWWWSAAIASPRTAVRPSLRFASPACNGGVHREIERGSRSDFEIPGLRDAPLDAGAVGAGAQLVKGQRVEPLHRLFLQFDPERPDDPVPEFAAGRIAHRVLAGFELAHRAHDVSEADPAALARETVATARAANADQHAVAHQLLQDRF